MKRFFRSISALSLSLAIAISSLCFGMTAFAEEKEEKGVLPKEEVVFAKKAGELKAKNSDVCGWIKIPGTSVNDPIVYSKDNLNYLRSDVNGKWDYFGSYFCDMDNMGFKNGNRDKLDRHTVIYGHNVYWGIKTPRVWLGHTLPILNTEALGADYKDGLGFAQIYKYKDPEFAKNHPYLYISTDKEDMVWEVFASYYTDLKFPFNSSQSLKDEQGLINVVCESKAKSLFDYNVPVYTSDNIITLSTCSYIEGPRVDDLRFHVCARLVKKGEALKENATITKNKDKIGYRHTLMF